MPRGSEVILAQKASRLVFLCFVTCEVAMFFCFPLYALVVLPDRRMRPAIFIHCTHIDQGRILQKNTVQGERCGGPERNETQSARSCMSLPGIFSFLM